MPLDRKRRGRRRRIASTLLIIAAAAVTLLVVVGALRDETRASAPYRRAVNRSFAGQLSILAGQSNATGRRLRVLMADLPGLGRAPLARQLDELAAEAAAQSSAAAFLEPPVPDPSAAPALLSAFAGRARATAELRNSLEGLLGVEPAATPGAATTGTRSTARPPTLLSSSQVLADLGAVGTELERADAEYAAGRRALATAAGNGHLPRSVWITHPAQWSPGALSVLVDQVVASRTLATRHQLQLVTVSLVPAAIPPPSGPTAPGGVTTVPPTSTLSVSVVVRNTGNVTEHGVVVTAQVARLPRGATASRHQVVSLAPGSSVAVALSPLPVSPGRQYTLAVVVTSAATGGVAARTSYTVAVGAATPPSTTTTTARPTTSTTRAAAPGPPPGGRGRPLPA